MEEAVESSPERTLWEIIGKTTNALMTVASDDAPAQIMTMITKLATGIDLVTDTGGVMNSRNNLNL